MRLFVSQKLPKFRKRNSNRIESFYILTIFIEILIFRAEFAEPKSIFEYPRNETHPWWNSRPCHAFGDSNVLIYGQQQAQALTKTLQVNELPKNVQELAANTEISNELDTQFKNSILQAHLFDTHQEKLPVRKHPVKKMWVFPRDFGITDQRKKYNFF